MWIVKPLGRGEQLEVELQTLQSVIRSQKELIEQLEQDVNDLQNLSTIHRGEAEGQAIDWVKEAVKDVGTGRSSAADSSAALGGVGTIFAESDTAITLIPILQGQRERFRQKNEELEAQNLEQQQQMALLHCEIGQLRADNVALYEKVRYLQSYSAQRPTSKALTFSSDSEQQYERQYEERLDPFASFSRRERQRKVAQLGPVERIMFSMGQMIVSSRAARTATLIYFMILHLLVFMVLYRLAYTETCHRDMAAECAEEYAQHMLQAHGH